jgi:hypothetical protein
VRKLIAALAAAAVLAFAPATAFGAGHGNGHGHGAHGVGNQVKECTGGLSFGQVISDATRNRGFNLGQHQRGAVPPGGAKGFLLNHCVNG